MAGEVFGPLVQGWLKDVRLLILCRTAVAGLLLAVLIVLHNRGKLRVNNRLMDYVLEPLALLVGMYSWGVENYGKRFCYERRHRV